MEREREWRTALLAVSWAAMARRGRARKVSSCNRCLAPMAILFLSPLPLSIPSVSFYFLYFAFPIAFFGHDVNAGRTEADRRRHRCSNPVRLLPRNRVQNRRWSSEGDVHIFSSFFLFPFLFSWNLSMELRWLLGFLDRRSMREMKDGYLSRKLHTRWSSKPSSTTKRKRKRGRRG